MLCLIFPQFSSSNQYFLSYNLLIFMIFHINHIIIKANLKIRIINLNLYCLIYYLELFRLKFDVDKNNKIYLILNKCYKL